MTRVRVLAVIPARWAASRFPGKPLARLWGKPLIQHVWERALGIEGVDERVVATDDRRIAEAARGFGAAVEMTSPRCASGTDRVAEVAERHPGSTIVVNLQGDEPELDASAVSALIAGMRADPSIRMATLAHREDDPRVLEAEDVVKAVVDADGFAIYFTRRDPAAGASAGSEVRSAFGGGPVEGRPGRILRHIGVYGFARELLLEFAAWPPGEAEQRERLEQLRALAHGVRIRVYESGRPAVGVDTPEQLAALESRGPTA